MLSTGLIKIERLCLKTIQRRSEVVSTSAQESPSRLYVNALGVLPVPWQDCFVEPVRPVYFKFALRTVFTIVLTGAVSIGLTFLAMGFEAALINSMVVLICATFSLVVSWLYIIQPLGAMFTQAHTASMKAFFERFRSVTDSMEDGLIVQDSEGRIVDFNESALRILGLTRDEILARKSVDTGWRSIDEDGNDFPAERQPAMTALATDRTARAVMGVNKPSGHVSWIDVASSPMVRLDSLNDGGAVPAIGDRHVISVFRDVTADRTMRERLEVGVRAVKFGIWDWNIAENSLYWDPSMFKVFDVKPEEFTGAYEAFEAMVVPEDRARIRSKLQTCFSHQADYSDEFQIQRRDGSIRTVRAESKGFYNKDGKPIRHIGVNWDVTEQRAQELRVINSSRMASLGEMASAIAHEINNPLAIISAQADLLRGYIEQGDLPLERLKVAMDRIDKMATRVAAIIRGLRSFSRDGSNDPLEVVNVPHLIADTMILCQARFENSGISVTVDIAEIDRGVDLECRPTQISQVLLNLLNNAFDAIAGTSDPWVKIDFEAYGDFVEIRVTDSGTGIPEEIRDKVMQPFFTTKTVGEGTGLGLSISLGIVSAHLGKLSIDRACPNTRLTVLLPRRQN